MVLICYLECVFLRFFMLLTISYFHCVISLWQHKSRSVGTCHCMVVDVVNSTYGVNGMLWLGRYLGWMWSFAFWCSKSSWAPSYTTCNHFHFLKLVASAKILAKKMISIAVAFILVCVTSFWHESPISWLWLLKSLCCFMFWFFNVRYRLTVEYLP